MDRTSEAKANVQLTWQERLLPLMSRMLVGLTVFFFLASLVQLYFLNVGIRAAPTISQANLIRPWQCPEGVPHETCFAIERMNTATLLEVNLIERRYHQAGVLLLGRVWYTYLGFVTGMILALVGAAFILGQLQMPSSQLEAKAAPV